MAKHTAIMFNLSTEPCKYQIIMLSTPQEWCNAGSILLIYSELNLL